MGKIKLDRFLNFRTAVLNPSPATSEFSTQLWLSFSRLNQTGLRPSQRRAKGLSSNVLTARGCSCTSPALTDTSKTFTASWWPPAAAQQPNQVQAAFPNSGKLSTGNRKLSQPTTAASWAKAVTSSKRSETSFKTGSASNGFRILTREQLMAMPGLEQKPGPNLVPSLVPSLVLNLVLNRASNPAPAPRLAPKLVPRTASNLRLQQNLRLRWQKVPKRSVCLTARGAFTSSSLGRCSTFTSTSSTTFAMTASLLTGATPALKVNLPEASGLHWKTSISGPTMMVTGLKRYIYLFHQYSLIKNEMPSV